MNVSEVLPNDNVRLVVPITIRTMRQGKRIVMADNQKIVQMQTHLLQSIAYVILWQQWLDEGRYNGVGELVKSYVTHNTSVLDTKIAEILEGIGTLQQRNRECNNSPFVVSY